MHRAIYPALTILAFTTVLSIFACDLKAAEPIACQTPSPCRIIILSREEEEALMGQNKILDTAMQGRPLDLMGMVTYFRDKIRNAPAGSNAPVEPQK